MRKKIKITASGRLDYTHRAWYLDGVTWRPLCWILAPGGVDRLTRKAIRRDYEEVLA